MKPKSFCLKFIIVIQTNLFKKRKKSFKADNSAELGDDIFVINSPMELEAEMCRYNCQTKEELDDILWYEYGVTLVLNFEHECDI